ncbi:MAG: iron-sulfur cluster insertion protein ErpA [Alphaproteobacteria bacterium]|nr:iron-sulfur cluster insertion protein ErpA [Alphaproteobacteria bacterium]MDP6590629.1 iron-sulfur cluster insertion protein ErpA [Alphaproteobacteria bacterium]
MARPTEGMVVHASGPITVSRSAAAQVARLLGNEENPDQALRVSVSGGGCSGFQYGFAFDSTRQDGDIVIEKEGVTVLIDSVSAGYMAGSEIDYVNDLIGASFQVKNPNAVSSCGCGTSFSLV